MQDHAIPEEEADVFFFFDSAVIELEEEYEFVALMTLSALRAPFYYLQQAAEMWARAQGVRQVLFILPPLPPPPPPPYLLSMASWLIL